MQQKIAQLSKIGRQKKFLLMLPLLVLPFFTFLLWSLGVVGAPESEEYSSSQLGFNMNLPSPLPAGDSNWNKLRFYEQADKKSARMHSLMKNDPYYQSSTSFDIKPSNQENALSLKDTLSKSYGFSYDPYPKGLQNSSDLNEEKVYQKLDLLKHELNKSTNQPRITKDSETLNHKDQMSSMETEELDKLESMMQNVQGGTTGDPEMKQINGMLEKILDIQHPDRVKDKLLQYSKENKQRVYPVNTVDHDDNISLLQPKHRAEVKFTADTIVTNRQIQNRNAFYSLNTENLNAEPLQSAIRARIQETQTLVSGETIRLRFATEVVIKGLLIPKEQFIIGTGTLNGDRLTVKIASIRYKDNILPVDLSVYDLDGMEGIYIPGTISTDVSKQATEQAIQGIGLASLDPSLGAQAASAGIQAAKTLIGKKTKLVKLTVKAGYQVLLRDNNQRN